MPLTDAQLLDFDAKRLASFDPVNARQTLAGPHGDAYRAQLVAAHWINYWRAGLVGDQNIGHSDEWKEGFEYAMREMAAHLRQGDLIPGGRLYEQTLSGELKPE